MTTHDKPSLALVFGHFSSPAGMRGWRDLEAFFNPRNAFGQVHVIAMGDPYEYPAYQFGSVHVHRIRSFLRPNILRRLGDIYALVLGTIMLRRLVRDRQIDLILQIDSTPLKYGLPAVLVAKRGKIPSVITLCNDYEEMMKNSSLLLRWFGRLVWPYLFKNCTRVRSKGHHIAQFALKYGVSRGKLCVIPNKQETEVFLSRPSAGELQRAAESMGLADLVHDSVVFVTVARLIPVKNIERVLRAFKEVRRRIPNLTYLIAGKGPLRESLEILAKELGVTDRVRFLGYLSHDQLRLVYHLSDVLVFPTLYEGHPRAVLEAMLCKMPIICANVGAVCEFVKNGRDGLWVNPQSVDAIASAMEQLAIDPKLRAELGRHATFDPYEYSVESVGAREAAFYLQTIRDHGRNSGSCTWSSGRKEEDQEQGALA